MSWPSRRIRNRVTIEELQQLKTPDQIDQIQRYWEDPEVGDQFIEIGSTEVLTVIGDNADEDNVDDYGLYYATAEGRKFVKFKNCLPIFTVHQLIDILQLSGSDLQIQRVDSKWFVVTQEGIFMGEENEELCSVLFKAFRRFVL